ncbi:hypothetical protein G3I61_19310 [Streptomyces diastaticus]|nr:hypothetical protein ADL09_10720 [Streptomyces sp. NRRL F-7442]NEB61814.1 hypothetical protein [Streptomyces diastaticus]
MLMPSHPRWDALHQHERMHRESTAGAPARAPRRSAPTGPTGDLPRETGGPLGPSAVTVLQRMAGNAATTRALAADRGRTPRGTDPTVQRAENDDAGGGTAAGAAETKSVAEGEVKSVGPGGTITYPSVTSCLTITVYLRDGGKVGGHASLFKAAGGMYSDQILPAIKAQVGKSRVERIDVSGAISSWNPAYLKTAIENSSTVPEQKNDPEGIRAVVSSVLGRQAKKVSVQETPDGTLTR